MHNCKPCKISTISLREGLNNLLSKTFIDFEDYEALVTRRLCKIQSDKFQNVKVTSASIKFFLTWLDGR
jgi:hypothetical protein